MRRITAIAGVSALAMLTAACSGSDTDQAEPVEEATEEVTDEAPAEEKAAELGAMETADGIAFASLTGDATAGKVVFAQCQACHTLEEGVNRVGPSLANVVGRAAGSVEGYNYSPANAESVVTWTDEQLYVYLENPQRIVPKTKMVYPGLKDAQKRADLVAYLKAPS